MRKFPIMLMVALLGACSNDDSESSSGEDGADGTDEASADDDAASSSSADDDGVDSEGDDGSDGGCNENIDCDEVEVCADGECSHALAHQYLITVNSYGGCMLDGFGDAEMYYRLLGTESGEPFTSPAVVCPAGWPDEREIIDPNNTLQIEFWELDAVFDDQLSTFCYSAEIGGGCGPVPPRVLHDEVVEEAWDDGLTVELEFALIPD
jgi:hypothetical protein